MKKSSFVSVVALALIVFFSQSPVLAGGGYFEVTAKNPGIAGKSSVEVDLYTYGQAYGIGPKIPSPPQTYSVRVENAPAGTSCSPEAVLSNSHGHANFTCMSQIPGTLQIYPYVQMKATGLWVKMTSKGSTQIHFDSENGGTSDNAVVPQPTLVSPTENTQKLQEKVNTLEDELSKTQAEARKQQEAMKSEIEALKAKTTEQQGQISKLKAYIESIFARISSFFSF